MKTKVLLGVVALVLGATPLSATTYTYEGNTISVSNMCFSATCSPSLGSGGFSANVVFALNSSNLSGTFDLSSEVINSAVLNYSGFGFGVSPLADYPANNSFGFINFSITLNAGTVTAWSLAIVPIGGPGGRGGGTSTSGDSVSRDTCFSGTNCGSGSGFAGPGVWSGRLEDQFSVIPLPAAIPLFATGLGVLGLLGWRRKRTLSKNRRPLVSCSCHMKTLLEPEFPSYGPPARVPDSSCDTL